jgi:hypothetical protein
MLSCGQHVTVRTYCRQLYIHNLNGACPLPSQVLQATFFSRALHSSYTSVWFAYKPQRWLLPRFLLDPVEPLRRVLGYETSEQTLMGQMTYPAKHVFWIRFFRESFISFRYFLESCGRSYSVVWILSGDISWKFPICRLDRTNVCIPRYSGLHTGFHPTTQYTR